jgi:hypothetical protein
MNQIATVERLLKRKKGVTAFEIIMEARTVCPHKRMSELKDRGWTITKTKVFGKNYHRYFGQAPKVGT